MTTIYVRKGGSDSNNGLTEALAKLTIAGAVAIAVSGDTINIGAGTFTENIGIHTVNMLTYQGAGMFKTIIAGNWSNTTKSVEMRDLKILTASAIGAHYGASIVLTRVWWDFGGLAGSYLTMYCPSVVLTGCVFANGDFSGGAYILFYDSGSPTFTVRNCTFYNITGSTGVLALSCNGVNVNFKNNIFHSVQRAALNQGSPTVAAHTYNCYYNSGGYVLSTGEFVANPLFVDAAGGDYRLSASSPCINAGLA